MQRWILLYRRRYIFSLSGQQSEPILANLDARGVAYATETTADVALSANSACSIVSVVRSPAEIYIAADAYCIYDRLLARQGL